MVRAIVTEGTRVSGGEPPAQAGRGARGAGGVARGGPLAGGCAMYGIEPMPHTYQGKLGKSPKYSERILFDS